MEYRVKFKDGWKWRTFLVQGHRYEQPMDKMVLYFLDGSVREIPAWSRREVVLGVDWVLAVKKRMESESGQSVPLSVGGA
jgi:hypothetical protein